MQVVQVAAGRWILVWPEPPRWSSASRRDRTFGVWTRQDQPRNIKKLVTGWYRMILRCFYAFQTDFKRTEQNAGFATSDKLMQSCNDGSSWGTFRPDRTAQTTVHIDNPTGQEVAWSLEWESRTCSIWKCLQYRNHLYMCTEDLEVFFAFFGAMVPNGEVLKHRSTNKINFKVAKSRDWSQGRDERNFLVSLRVWGLSWFAAKCILSAVFILLESFHSNHFTISDSCHSMSIHYETEHFLSMGAMQVLNNRVVLPPLESTDITIEYSPSSLGASVSINTDVRSQPSRLASVRQSTVCHHNSYCHIVKIKIYHNHKDL